MTISNEKFCLYFSLKCAYMILWPWCCENLIRILLFSTFFLKSRLTIPVWFVEEAVDACVLLKGNFAKPPNILELLKTSIQTLYFTVVCVRVTEIVQYFMMNSCVYFLCNCLNLIKWTIWELLELWWVFFYLMINIFWASTGKENGKLMSWNFLFLNKQTNKQ